jgi:hypothetical protein
VCLYTSGCEKVKGVPSQVPVGAYGTHNITVSVYEHIVVFLYSLVPNIHECLCVDFEVLTATVMKGPIIRDTALYNPVHVHERFGGKYCHHHQGVRVMRPSSK